MTASKEDIERHRGRVNISGRCVLFGRQVPCAACAKLKSSTSRAEAPRVTNGRRRDVPRSPTGRVPQWVRDEADGKPSTPTPWRAAPSTFLGEPTSHRPRSRRGRNAVSTLVVAGLVIAAAAWSVTGHNLLPQSTPSTQAAAQAPTGAVARNAPPVGQEEAPAALGAPAVQAGASTSFRFKSVQPGSTAPVTWSPCRPIHYVVPPRQHPTGRRAGSCPGRCRGLARQRASLRVRRPGERGSCPGPGAVSARRVRRPLGAGSHRLGDRRRGAGLRS